MAAGRPGLFTEEVGRAICEKIAKGVPESIVVQSIGITTRQLLRWKKKHVEFGLAVKRARGEAAEERIQLIRKAAEGGAEYETKVTIKTAKDGSVTKIVEKKKTPPLWTPAAWYMERQFCEEFAQNRLDLKELLQLLRAAKKDRLEIAREDQGQNQRAKKSKRKRAVAKSQELANASK